MQQQCYKIYSKIMGSRSSTDESIIIWGVGMLKMKTKNIE